MLSLNDPKAACRFTGFLPLHAVVASGHKAMYDFLVELPNLPMLHGHHASESVHSQARVRRELARCWSACGLLTAPISSFSVMTPSDQFTDARHPRRCTLCNRFKWRHASRLQAGTLAQMTPLQLACYLGDHDMCEHMLIRRSEIVWRWGPITQFKIDLCATPNTSHHPQISAYPLTWTLTLTAKLDVCFKVSLSPSSRVVGAASQGRD